MRAQCGGGFSPEHSSNRPRRTNDTKQERGALCVIFREAKTNLEKEEDEYAVDSGAGVGVWGVVDDGGFGGDGCSDKCLVVFPEVVDLP